MYWTVLSGAVTTRAGSSLLVRTPQPSHYLLTPNLIRLSKELYCYGPGGAFTFTNNSLCSWQTMPHCVGQGPSSYYTAQFAVSVALHETFGCVLRPAGRGLLPCVVQGDSNEHSEGYEARHSSKANNSVTELIEQPSVCDGR